MFLQDSTEEDPPEKNGIAYEDQLENFVKMSRRRPAQNNAKRDLAIIDETIHVPSKEHPYLELDQVFRPLEAVKVLSDFERKLNQT